VEDAVRRIREKLLKVVCTVAFLSFLPLGGAGRALADDSTPARGTVLDSLEARGSVVAVSHPLAAGAGARMLEQGGNAIDAAAAIVFALNVVEPQSSGMGGGGFMLIHLAETDQTFFVDSREQAPAAATPDMFGDLSFADASTSGISVGVPGAVRGVSTALERWGTLKLADVLKPAIALAEDGFRINGVLAADILDKTRGVVMTTLQPETAAVFQPNGAPLKAGDRLVQPDLAKTFRLLAEKGPDAFYTGEVAQAIVDAQRRTRAGPTGVGRMALQDLAEYQAKIRQPVTGSYRGFGIASMSPPSSGGLTIVQMLKMMERFPLGDASQGFGFGSQRTLHVMIEAMRLAFADRAVWMGDEDFVHVPKTGLLAEPYVQSRSALISLDRRMPNPTAGNPLPFDGGARSGEGARSGALQPEGIHTTHFVVADRRGNVVSYTNTIESVFGSGIMVPGYGFMLNNELTDFNMKPTANANGNPGANDVAPRKRPRSSMSPTLLFKDGKPFAAYGSPGGATIINTVLQITLDLVDHKMTVQQAIDAPRISVTSAAGKVSCEQGALVPLGFSPTPQLSQRVLDALRGLGHDLSGCGNVPIGSVQAVVFDRESGARSAGADARRQGTVVRVSVAGSSGSGGE
jgi:gamma-glutamyltranspeptidase / glutathione hydrolase